MSDRHVLATCAFLGVIIGLGPLARLALPSSNHANAAVERAMAASPTAMVETQTARAEQQPAESEQDQDRDAAPTPEPQQPEAAPDETALVEQQGASAEQQAGPPPAPEPTARPASLLDDGQLVVFYGTPLSGNLGILGQFSADEAAQRVRDQAAYYDSLNGDRGARPALDLIYALVQSEPTENGLYLRYLSDETVEEYIRVAEQYDTQLILDLQIGRGTLLEEVRKVERFLVNPRVHVAVDPEYAVGSEGVPIYTPGTITGNDINAIQDYLRDLVVQHNLPPKLLVIHQYMEDTVLGGYDTRDVPEVNLVLNMDAYGDAQDKRDKYATFAVRPYAEYRSFNIFLNHDQPVMTEQETLQLSPEPDVIFYQ